MDKILIALLIFALLVGAACGAFYFLNEKNADEMAEYIDSLVEAPLQPTLHPDKDENGNWFFTTDEDFKVLHLTDVHLSGGILQAKDDRKALRAAAAMVMAEDPDLVIIAFGMNDGCSMDPNTYTNNINKMVSTINENCPDACIVVVGTCLPNPEFAWSPGGAPALKYHIDYIEYLKSAEFTWKNAAHADVTTANIEIYERKVYQDLAGSNSNHPNDYMHRIYAQVIIQTIFGDYLTY